MSWFPSQPKYLIKRNLSLAVFKTVLLFQLVPWEVQQPTSWWSFNSLYRSRKFGGGKKLPENKSSHFLPPTHPPSPRLTHTHRDRETCGWNEQKRARTHHPSYYSPRKRDALFCNCWYSTFFLPSTLSTPVGEWVSARVLLFHIYVFAE